MGDRQNPTLQRFGQTRPLSRALQSTSASMFNTPWRRRCWSTWSRSCGASGLLPSIALELYPSLAAVAAEAMAVLRRFWLLLLLAAAAGCCLLLPLLLLYWTEDRSVSLL